MKPNPMPLKRCAKTDDIIEPRLKVILLSFIIKVNHFRFFSFFVPSIKFSSSCYFLGAKFSLKPMWWVNCQKMGAHTCGVTSCFSSKIVPSPFVYNSIMYIFCNANIFLKPMWWVNCQEMAARALHARVRGDLVLFPQNLKYEKNWDNWMKGIKDWYALSILYYLFA
jgi:hypothetical protein